MLVCSMFYTRKEVSERIGWTFGCNGIAVIITGFVQFGMVHAPMRRRLDQWQWLMITVSLLSFISSILFFFLFPDNPLNAWFLTSEERITAVRRVRENQNGIETKVWKRYQMVEALSDPKSWLYLLFMVFGTLTSGIALQYSLLIKGFGFTELQTTLLGIPSGIAQVIGITLACYAVWRFPVRR